MSPFDAEKEAPYVPELLKIVEHGTQHQKIDLVRAIEEYNGSIDWLHLIMYDSTDARYAALRVVSKRNVIESGPHLLNFIERTYEEAGNVEGGIFHVDDRPFKYQGMAIETVEALLGEPILEAGSIASGQSRSIGGFAFTHGYREEMKTAVLNAERLLVERNDGIGNLEIQGVDEVAYLPSETGSSTEPNSKYVPNKEPSRLEGNGMVEKRRSDSALGYLLLACLLVGGVFLVKIMKR